MNNKIDDDENGNWKIKKNKINKLISKIKLFYWYYIEIN